MTSRPAPPSLRSRPSSTCSTPTLRAPDTSCSSQPGSTSSLCSPGWTRARMSTGCTRTTWGASSSGRQRRCLPEDEAPQVVRVQPVDILARVHPGEQSELVEPGWLLHEVSGARRVGVEQVDDGLDLRLGGAGREAMPNTPYADLGAVLVLGVDVPLGPRVLADPNGPETGDDAELGQRRDTALELFFDGRQGRFAVQSLRSHDGNLSTGKLDPTHATPGREKLQRQETGWEAGIAPRTGVAPPDGMRARHTVGTAYEGWAFQVVNGANGQTPVENDVPDGYEDLERIDQGGFATVFRARDIRFDRTVALKVLRSDTLNDRQLRRFRAECLATGRVSSHPNIVTVYGAGTTRGRRPWLAMEYCSGGSLAGKVAAQGPLPVDEVVSIGARLCSALHAAHEAGILHRDVKPHNVLVTAYGEPALADFGIASVAIEDDTGSVATETAAYTVVHAAPEILEGNAATAASDIYSLGSTLYTCLLYTSPSPRDRTRSRMPS